METRALRVKLASIFPTSTSLTLPPFLIMASFFDIKARKAAAAEASSSKTAAKPQADSRSQPWVEK